MVYRWFCALPQSRSVIKNASNAQTIDDGGPTDLRHNRVPGLRGVGPPGRRPGAATWYAAGVHPDSVLNLPDQPRMLDVVRQGLDGATEVCVAVSFTRFSGLGLLVDPLREVVEGGGTVRLLTSTYQCVTQPDALAALGRIAGVETRVQDGALGFHAKFWWFHKAGGAELWAGSSNLSKGRLATNLEWNLRSVDPRLVEATRHQFDLLWRRDDVRVPDEAFLQDYRARYKARGADAGPLGPASPPLVASPYQPPPAPNAAQREALLALSGLRARGERRAAVIAATGVGKTFLAAFDVLQSGARRVLYVSHRLEHLHQARRTFAAVMPRRRATRRSGRRGSRRSCSA